jgi:hypothetical protein
MKMQDKEVNKNVKNIFLSMCDVKVFLTFTSLNLVRGVQFLFVVFQSSFFVFVLFLLAIVLSIVRFAATPLVPSDI